MHKKINKVGVLTSGGDAPGMNAAIRAVVRSCAFHNIHCVGIYRGFEGLIENDFEDLDARSVRNIISRGGTFLKSARSLEFETTEGRQKAYENLKNADIEALVIIGGNGTFKGGLLFEEEFNFPVIGIPATIDNDINGTDFTIGYDTALNTVVEAIDKIRDTASSHNRLFLIEVMGRDAGAIALNSGIGAGAEEILIPEEEHGIDRLLDGLRISKKSGKTSNIIVVSEGYRSGKNIFEIAEFLDKNLEDYDIRVSVLGHIQRGGSPSCFDRVLASKLGVGAIDAIMEGERKIMIAIHHQKVIRVPLETGIKVEIKFDKDLRRVANITSV